MNDTFEAIAKGIKYARDSFERCHVLVVIGETVPIQIMRTIWLGDVTIPYDGALAVRANQSLVYVASVVDHESEQRLVSRSRSMMVSAVFYARDVMDALETETVQALTSRIREPSRTNTTCGVKLDFEPIGEDTSVPVVTIATPSGTAVYRRTITHKGVQRTVIVLETIHLLADLMANPTLWEFSEG